MLKVLSGISECSRSHMISMQASRYELSSVVRRRSILRSYHLESFSALAYVQDRGRASPYWLPWASKICRRCRVPTVFERGGVENASIRHRACCYANCSSLENAVLRGSEDCVVRLGKPRLRHLHMNEANKTDPSGFGILTHESIQGTLEL